MPYDDPDPTDPMTLCGVVMECPDGSAMREMADCFVEELAGIGLDADRILEIFKSAGYAGPHAAYRALGERTIATMIEKSLRRRGMHRRTQRPSTRRRVAISLPVLVGEAAPTFPSHAEETDRA